MRRTHQKRHSDYPPNDSLEVFKTLPESDFWPYIPQKTRSAILDLLDEYLDRCVEKSDENHVPER